MMEAAMDREILSDRLDAVLSAHERMIRAQVDAGACQTRRDFDNAHRREEEYETAREAFLDAVAPRGR